MNKDISKDTYIGIVDFTLDSMIELAKNDPNYILRMDLLYYYNKKIVSDGILSKEEFAELCKKKGLVFSTE